MPLQRHIVITLFLMVLMLSGCAEYRNLVLPSKVFENSYLVPEHSEQAVTVHFIRRDDFFGKGVAVPVYLNSEPLMRQRVKTFTTMYLKPGHYTITIGEDLTKKYGSPYGKNFSGALVFSSGETYYVLLYADHYGPSIFAQHIRFKTIESEQARNLMHEFKFISLPKLTGAALD